MDRLHVYDERTGRYLGYFKVYSIIVDDGSRNIDELRRLCNGYNRLELLELDVNLGSTKLILQAPLPLLI